VPDTSDPGPPSMYGPNPQMPVPDTSDPGPPSMYGPNPQMPVPGGDFGGGDFGGGDFGGGDPADIVNPDTDPVSPFEGVDGNSSDYARKLAYINFLRDALGRQGLRGFADIEREFLLAQRALPGAYNRRGLLDSGQYARGKGLLGDSASRASGRFMSDLRDQYFNLALSEGDADNAYSSEGFAALQALADKLAADAASIGTVGFGAI